MEPDLWELFEYGEADDEVAAIIRLGHYATVPAGVRVISQFENIVTVRLSRKDIPKISGAPEVDAMSAGDTYLGPELELDDAEAAGLPPTSAVDTDTRRPEGLGMTGRGIAVGVVDWGFDFAHPDFRKADGTTRILALWDQRGGKLPASPKPFGYGVLHTRDDINSALKEKDPYAALKYHPADADTGGGSHGTHVLSIAAGTGGDGRPIGLAPEADLILVHNAPWDGLEAGKLGDSVTLLEGIAFISQTAAGRPWVINLSMGRHGEQHDGSTLIELGLDAAVRSAPGRAVVLSTGNYFNKRIHASGQLRPTEERTFAWVINEGTPSDYNQLEVWYSWQDKFEVTVRSPDGSLSARARLGEKVKLLSGGKEIGNVYHRAQEPNTLDHHITIFLYKAAPAGEWDITVSGLDVIRGDYHAWIEREVSCPACQSRFNEKDADPRSTTGTICNGRRTLAVGAYSTHDPERRLGPFSSVGPTRDGRLKPDLCAPGVSVLAARSSPRTEADTAPLLTRMSGTSMAAPHVTGTVALMFQAAVKPLRIEQTHNLLLGNAERVSIPEDNPQRVGIGFLDVEAAVEAAAGADQTARAFKPVPAQKAPTKSDAAAASPRAPAKSATAASPQKTPQQGSWSAPPARTWVQAEFGERYGTQSSSANTLGLALAAAAAADEAEAIGKPASMNEGEAIGRSTAATKAPVDALASGEGVAAGEAVSAGRSDAARPSVTVTSSEALGAEAVTHPVLRRGSTGDAVREAQQKLNAYHTAEVAAQRAGLPGCPLAIDGAFGSLTYAATYAFQQRVFAGQPRELDGVIGPHTWAKLDLIAPGPLPPPDPSPAVTFNTNPTYWFLDGNEIDGARGNAETKRRLAAFTSQNLVQPLIDGEEYMKALFDDLSATASGDFFNLTAWRLNIAQDLVPAAPATAGSPSRLDALLRTIGTRGVQPRALIFKAVAGGYAPSSITSQIRENTQARDWFNTVGGRGVIDGRYPAAGSHHQKSAVVLRSGEAVAYCGGIDIAPDRWDTQRHDSDPRRTPENYAGWHDVHLRLRGPAVLDVEANFRDRWNARDEVPSFIPYEPLPPVIRGPAPPVAASPGTHHVQVLRTYACIHQHFKDFAPAGETTCLAGYLKAISRAQNYIYLEDQYLVSAELALALDAALDNIKKLVILVPEAADAPPVEASNFHQALFLRIVNARHPGKVHVYHPVQPSSGRSIYVHAKLMIVDDVYAVVGSPNVNRRSMTHDTEIAAAVVDADLVDGVCRYARDLRRRLWGEHLSLAVSDPAIADPILGVDEWERQAATGTKRVRRHVTPGPQSEWRRTWDTAVDPDGRCAGGAVAPRPVPALPAAAEIMSGVGAMESTELADTLITQQRLTGQPAPVLHEWLTEQGLGHILVLPGVQRPPSAAEIFDAVVYAPTLPIGARILEYFDLLAAPGALLDCELRPSDVLVRRGPGGFGHIALVSAPELRTYEGVLAAGGTAERRLPGHFAHVVEGGASPHTSEDDFHRRIVDEYGRIPPDTAIMRGKWQGEASERLDPLSLVLGMNLASGVSRPAPAAAAPVATTSSKDPDEAEALGTEGSGTLPSLSAWEDLISFRPTAAVQSSVRSRVTGVRLWAGWPFQTLEEKAAGPINLDYYPVLVQRLPQLGGSRLSATEMLEYLRLNFNSFVDNRFANFAPYDAKEAARWSSSSPLGSIIHIDMRMGSALANPDDGSVACTEAAADHWIFSTLWTLADLAHPLSGNRMFGFTTSDAGVTFYTRGADRPARLIDDLLQGTLFSQAHGLWMSLQQKIAAFVNANSGAASIGVAVSERYDWSAVKAAYHHPARSWI